MPQDQDDINGADAMKQAPTPGPLDSKSVKLLVKGDLLRHPYFGVYFYPGRDPFEKLEGFSFIGRPDADGWITHDGGKNPLPRQRVEIRCRTDPTVKGDSEPFRWSHDGSNPRADIIAFRLAPPAPVEASGSEREVERFRQMVEEKLAVAMRAAHVDAPFPMDERQAASYHRTRADLLGWVLDMLPPVDGPLIPIRPQPSGETRKAAWTYCPECGSDEVGYEEGDHKQCDGCGQEWFSDLDYSDVVQKNLARLSSRPAPVASGGQHSSGEDVVQWFKPSERTPESGMKFVALHEDGSGAWLGFMHDGGILDADGEDYSTTLKGVDCWAYLPTGYEFCCEGYPEEALALPDHVCPPLSTIPAPVAETAGEALWFEKGFTSPNVPAQDDDKLRIAVEALEEVEHLIKISPDVPSDDFDRGARAARLQAFDIASAALSALKSTSALEGGQ